MKAQTKRIILYIAIAAVILIGGIAAILIAPKDTPVSAQEHIDLGHTYLIELSYDKAVLEFNEAIEIEPMNADAYLGLAEAYAGMGDTDRAVEALELGYERAGDERILALLNQLKPAEETPTTAAETTVTTTAETTSSTVDEYGYVYDNNASYKMDIISDKEAHFEISSEIITDDFRLKYNPNVYENLQVLECSLNFSNLSIGVFAWNSSNSETNYEWNDMVYPQIFVIDDGNYGTDIFSYLYDDDYDSYPVIIFNVNVNTAENKIMFDVKIPDDFDFSFNDCGTPKLEIFYNKDNEQQ